MRPTWSRFAPVAVAVAVLVAAVGAFALLGGDADQPPSRQDDVAARGALVMPFDLERTSHVFTATESGGTQAVLSDPPVDVEQVELIRGHLREERDRFSTGDFGDPASIHGDDMPGLAVLRTEYDAVDVTYVELSDGARLVYESDDPRVVTAIHEWFDAQVADHGAHAEHGDAS